MSDPRLALSQPGITMTEDGLHGLADDIRPYLANKQVRMVITRYDGEVIDETFTVSAVRYTPYAQPGNTITGFILIDAPNETTLALWPGTERTSDGWDKQIEFHRPGLDHIVFTILG
jgi:hypothetical protein